MIPDKALESLAPRLVGHDGKPLLSNGVFDSNVLESYLSEDELLDEEEEADMSLLPQSVKKKKKKSLPLNTDLAESMPYAQL